MYVWSQSIQLSPNDDANKIIHQLNIALEQSNFDARTERYAYLTLIQLKSRNLISDVVYQTYTQQMKTIKTN